MATKKKDLLAAANTNRVYNTIAEATAEPDEAPAAAAQPAAMPEPLPRRSRNKAPTDEEIATVRALGRTQGRKGCKAIRINMAFAPELFEYIHVMSRVKGQSITAFTNEVFRNSMEQNAANYEQAKEFLSKFEKGT